MTSAGRTAMALALGLIFVSLAGQCYAGSSAALEVGFYKGKCGVFDVESIVAGLVKAKFFKDPTIAPALIRMQFHDCFVSGCDASLLLNGGSSERSASPNLSVRGYEFIDEVKDAVESFCPGLVSCADIIAIATRDAISLSGGGRYRVETGRRDGFESLAEINVDLPGPQIPVSESIAAFARKGLNLTDMVYLLGGHTVGVAHCFFFQDRLYNFQKTGRPDPTMDQELVRSLRSRCPQKSTGNNIVSLDQNFLSSFIVDNSFYQQILRKRGVLQIDQRLALDPRTRDIVTTIASGTRASDFGSKFGEAMIKMGAIQVLTGTEGEIRKSCSVIN